MRDAFLEFEDIMNRNERKGSYEITPEVAATLVLADAVNNLIGDRFGHEICMGIRMGLFGVNAGSNEDIRNKGEY